MRSYLILMNSKKYLNNYSSYLKQKAPSILELFVLLFAFNVKQLLP